MTDIIAQGLALAAQANFKKTNFAIPVPKLGFAGDSIMDRLNLKSASSGLWQAMLDRPRLINFDPAASGSSATSGSSSGSAVSGDLLWPATLAAQISYGADYIFGLTGGNDSGGTSTYTDITNIQTYANAIWAAKPSTKIVWHVPTPQWRSASQGAINLQGMRNSLHEMQKRDSRFIVSDVSEYMVDPLTAFQPVNLSGTAGANVLGGVVETTNGQHPTAYCGWITRGHYDKILDKLGVPEISGFPIATNGYYNASTNPGGNLLGPNFNNPFGSFAGSGAVNSTPANFTGTMSTQWNPVTPTQMVCAGTALAAMPLPSASMTTGGRTLNSMKIALNTGVATIASSDTVGITRTGMTWAPSAASPVVGRFFAYVYLENVVGIASLNITVSGIKNSAGLNYTFGSLIDPVNLSQVWNAGNPVTRLCKVAMPMDIPFDTGSSFTVTASATFAAGTTPSGNIYFASFVMEPILNGF